MPPVSTDMGVPAMVAIQAPPSQTGLVLSLFMAGFAFMQLGLGPVGRATVLAFAIVRDRFEGVDGRD